MAITSLAVPDSLCTSLLAMFPFCVMPNLFGEKGTLVEAAFSCAIVTISCCKQQLISLLRLETGIVYIL